MRLSEYTGMDARTGHPLTGLNHLRQSVFDILTTRKGERVMRPEYGSNLFTLVDRPVNAEFLIDLYFEAITAIHRWEPRVRVTKVRADVQTAGRVSIDLTVRVDGALTRLDPIEVTL